MTAWPFMALIDMPTLAPLVTARRYLQNADDAWRAAQDTDTPFYIMCALLEKESMGKNIYGHDKGGVFNVPGELPVTESNFKIFYERVVVNKQTSNGVGPLQITWRGFFPQMKEQGLRAWVPYDNMFFGARLFMGYYNTARSQGHSERESIRRAGVRYNGAAAYGDRLLVIADKWRDRLS